MSSFVVQPNNAVEFFSTGFITFNLRSGLKVRVENLHIDLTYQGWIEGLPCPAFNDLFLGDPKQTARKYRSREDVPIYVCNVRPHELTGDFSNGAGDGDAPATDTAQFFPRLRLVAHCFAGEEDRFTELMIVWFQDHFDPMPEPSIRTEIEQLEWYRHAKEYDPY